MLGQLGLSYCQKDRTDEDPETLLGADGALELSMSVFFFPDHLFTSS